MAKYIKKSLPYSPYQNPGKRKVTGGAKSEAAARRSRQAGTEELQGGHITLQLLF